MMFFQIDGKIVNEDNILLVVPGFVAMMIVDIEHFVDINNPQRWQWTHPENEAFVVHLRTGEKLLVAKMRHNGEYERLATWHDGIREQTTAYGPYHTAPLTNEQKQEQERNKLKKELDF